MPENNIDDKSTLDRVMAGAFRYQAIIWADADSDLCCHMASSGRNELMNYSVNYFNQESYEKCYVHISIIKSV